MWWCCEVQPLRDGGVEPVHSGALARSSRCACAMAARNSCVVTPWRCPASARQRSRARPWRWRREAPAQRWRRADGAQTLLSGGVAPTGPSPYAAARN